MTHKKKRQAIEIDPLITEMLKIADRAFKNLNINIFSTLTYKILYFAETKTSFCGIFLGRKEKKNHHNLIIQKQIQFQGLYSEMIISSSHRTFSRNSPPDSMRLFSQNCFTCLCLNQLFSRRMKS